MLRQNYALFKILRYLQIIWLLPVLLIVSCSGNPIIKGIPGEQGSVVEAGEKDKTQETFRFILGPGDEIAVKVWRNDDLARTLQVDPSGNVQIPLAGELKASGLTISQLREEVTLRLSEYIVDPQVDIVVSDLKNLKVHVLGEVKSPGSFAWRSGMLAWESISQAGGFTTDADEKNILLVRNENDKAVIKALNLNKMLKGENLTQNICLRNGDLVYVLPTFIANVERFMQRFYNIINPFVALESGIVLYPSARDVLRGKESSGNVIVTP
ncbi:MAG: polysaccharide export protein [Deltaproteobacteria bacterium]|nr:polysaccharide export protein [Deltaproteobacteria bacterium]